MPFRSPKMYSFIFGFHRFVWWPKCTPASSRSLIAIPGKLPPSSLTFTELEPFTGASETVLLPFLDARVRRQQAVLLQLLAQLRVVFDERGGDAEPHRARLAVLTAAGDRGEDVELLARLGQHQRPPHLHAQGVGGEELLELSVIDRDGAVAGPEEHAGGGCLA